MKIVTIWNTYGPYHIARVEALRKIFINADIICFSHCKANDDYPFFNYQPRNHRVLVQSNSSDLRFLESFSAAIRNLWSEKPDLILTIGYERPETLASVVYARISGKSVFLMMDNQYNDRYRKTYVELLKKIYLKLFDGYIYGGDTHIDYLRRLGADRARMASGYNCIDNDAFYYGVLTKKELGQRLISHKDYFLCVARLVPKKNLVLLIHAFAAYVKRIAETKKPWSLVICGEGPELPTIQKAIQECSIATDVLLVGRVDNFDEILNYYAFARLLVLPSLIEQWGLVVNEAMASGLPVVVSQQCGCASNLIKNGENGFTFDANSVEQLAAHLVWMHDNEEMLPQMGERSREIIQNYSPENFARNVLSLYKKTQKSDA